MIESTKPVTDTDYEPEILARYTKVLPKGRRGCHHQLKTDLTVEIKQTSEEWFATVEIECLYEWGVGETEEQAIDDLVCSLGDYKLWLDKHRDNLAECSSRDLELIENMVV